MAKVATMNQGDPSGLQANVFALIEHSFAGDGGIDLAQPVQAAYRHHFQVPGSATRIRLVASCAKFLQISDADICCLAAAVECLHNASLVQDDLQDDSTHRRGQASVVARFGQDVALGLTDQLITSAFVSLAGLSRTAALPEVLRTVHAAVAETVEGQSFELVGCPEGDPVEAQLQAARKKSGPLFALALELPLILAGQQKFLGTAHNAACLFGLGYQILDDLKDQAVDAEKKGSGNFVFTLKANSDSGDAAAAAANRAFQFLRDASHSAATLPLGSGKPLIELIERILPQIDAFKP